MYGFRASAIITGALSAALMTASVRTVEADGITTSISGFGTVGGTMTSDGNYAYIHDGSEFVGATQQFDIGLESRIGVQGTIDFGSGFSVTVQELARQRGSDKFALGTEWIYAQYSPDPDWSFRLGRVTLPTFLISDSREVGYAAPWFRAPNEVYASESFQYLDGAEILWRHDVGAVRLGLQAAYGSTQEGYLADGTVYDTNVKDAYNIAAKLEYGDFLVRLSRTVLSIPGFLPLSPSYEVHFPIKDAFDCMGVQYDNGKAIVLSEFAKRSENPAPIIGEALEESDAWYVAGGWRFGKMTPMLIYGKFNAKQSLAFRQGSYGTWSASLRYDLLRNVALKAQYSRPQAANPNYWVQPDATSDERVNVYSVGADFVF